MKSSTFNTLTGASLLTLAVMAPIALADGNKPKHSVKEVMKAVHKGEDNIGKRVAKGTASKEDITRMLEYYQSLPLNDPPRGEKDSWTLKTAALLTSAKKLKSGEPDALEAYKAASNCKACHNVHKPE